MNPVIENQLLQTRRQFFGTTGLRLGGITLASLLASRGTARAADSASQLMYPALPGLPHFAPKAKALIYLHMNGGPSQIDTFDYKPVLNEHFDKGLPDSVRQGQRITTMTSGQSLLPVPPSKFKLPHHASCPTPLSH